MSRLLLSAVSACTLLAACNAAEDETAPPPAEAPPPAAGPVASAAVAAVALPGEYRIAGVDGAEIDLPHGITASIDGGRIHVTSDCVNIAWRYRFEGARLVTERAPTESCARGLDPTEQALLAAFDGAETVRRTPVNAVELSGGGHSVTLFSQ